MKCFVTMTAIELKNIAIIALVFAMRMLGLLMVAPVLSLYADTLPGADLRLIGVAIGIYGLTQACFQLPFGVLSDRWGRKNTVIVGLLVFGVGTLVAAMSETMTGLIIGRALQGMGAVGSTLLAWAADLTRDSVRTRAMAIVGMSIGLTFILALILGPTIDAYWGLSGIFQLTAGLTGLSLILVSCSLPEPPRVASPPTSLFSGFKDLSGLHAGVFTVHALITASFLVLPLQMGQLLDLAPQAMWRFYVPVLLAALFLMSPFLRRSDQKNVALWPSIALVLIGISGALMPIAWQPTVFIAAAIGFFAAFTFLEAALPAMVSRLAPPQRKGAAMGAYAFSQFLGMFTGGVAGGYVLTHWGNRGVSVGCFLLAMLACFVLQLTFQEARRRLSAEPLQSI